MSDGVPRADYAAKPDGYFSAARADIVARMPANPAARVIEIGCGSGVTGVLARRAGKAGHYTGVEQNERAAAAAHGVIDAVVVGDAEAIDLAQLGGPFDVAILSEVLEHLVDPWALVARLRKVMVPGGLVYASSPNAASIHIVRQLLGGRFDYADAGPMDRTHLRWFTPHTYREMFEQAGFATVEITGMRPRTRKWRLFNRLTGGWLAHLADPQICFTGRAAS